MIELTGSDRLQTVSRSSAIAHVEESNYELARQITDQVFDSLRWSNVKDGIVEDVSYLDSWKQRTPSDIEADIAYLEIDRSAILSALSRYLEKNSLKTRELDWLFLNVLVYAEYVATVIEIRKNILGIDAYIKSVHPPKKEHPLGISEITVRPWWNVGAFILTALTAFVHPLLALILGFCLLYLHIRRKNGIKKINIIFQTMLRVYMSFNTIDLSWEHVAAELNESRRLGVIWDSSIFKLIEIRQRGS